LTPSYTPQTRLNFLVDSFQEANRYQAAITSATRAMATPQPVRLGRNTGVPSFLSHSPGASTCRVSEVPTANITTAIPSLTCPSPARQDHADAEEEPAEERSEPEAWEHPVPFVFQVGELQDREAHHAHHQGKRRRPRVVRLAAHERLPGRPAGEEEG